MGLLSWIFSSSASNPKSKIEDCQRRIANFKNNIEIIKRNNVNKTQAHYKESARKNIATLKYQIEKEKEKIRILRKQK